MGDAEYFVGRAGTQLMLARQASLRTVALVHLELSGLYLARAQTLIDAHRREERRANVVSIRR